MLARLLHPLGVLKSSLPGQGFGDFFGALERIGEGGLGLASEPPNDLPHQAVVLEPHVHVAPARRKAASVIASNARPGLGMPGAAADRVAALEQFHGRVQPGAATEGTEDERLAPWRLTVGAR